MSGGGGTRGEGCWARMGFVYLSRKSTKKWRCTGSAWKEHPSGRKYRQHRVTQLCKFDENGVITSFIFRRVDGLGYIFLLTVVFMV